MFRGQTLKAFGPIINKLFVCGRSLFVHVVSNPRVFQPEFYKPTGSSGAFSFLMRFLFDHKSVARIVG